MINMQDLNRTEIERNVPLFCVSCWFTSGTGHSGSDTFGNSVN